MNDRWELQLQWFPQTKCLTGYPSNIGSASSNSSKKPDELTGRDLTEIPVAEFVRNRTASHHCPKSHDFGYTLTTLATRTVAQLADTSVTSNSRILFAGIFVCDWSPYASADGINNLATVPTGNSANASSHPLITWPCPRVKLKGVTCPNCESTLESNSVPNVPSVFKKRAPCSSPSGSGRRRSGRPRYRRS